MVVFAVRKGHSTPWEMQLRHAGCRSSHWSCQLAACISPSRIRTLIFLRLQMAQPVRLLRCVRRAGRGGTLELCGGFPRAFSGGSLRAPASEGGVCTPDMMNKSRGFRRKHQDGSFLSHYCERPAQFQRCRPLICLASRFRRMSARPDEVSGSKEETRLPTARQMQLETQVLASGGRMI